jgi:lipoprotein-releasing system ATP-binding protein
MSSDYGAGNREELLRAEGLHKHYHDGSRTIHVLQGASLTLGPGETVAITGRSGSGKSTLLHLLGLLDRPTYGQIYFRSTETGGLRERDRDRLRSRHLGFIFQAYHLVAELSALENVALAARIAGSWVRHRQSGSVRAGAAGLLELVGLGDRLHHRPAKLSGGEKQRVAIARALMCSPEVLLADEPTGNLDAATAAEVEGLIFRLVSERRLAMVLVTHEAALAARCDREFRMEGGLLHAGGSPDPLAPPRQADESTEGSKTWESGSG